jgi:DNA-directed RNA polymerase subunit RPC12/RpoP
MSTMQTKRKLPDIHVRIRPVIDYTNDPKRKEPPRFMCYRCGYASREDCFIDLALDEINCPRCHYRRIGWYKKN